MEFDLDLIHVHYSIPHATASFIARGITGIPYIVTLHGSDVTLLGNDLSYKLANKFSVEEADGITAVSGFIAKKAAKCLGIQKKISVIPNFVDTKIFSPIPCIESESRNKRTIVITHVSNFRPVKRIQDIVKAMKIVTEEAPKARLVLVGDGPERHRIEKLVDDLDLFNNVLLTGYRSDIANLLKCSDVAVLCSETESAPLTLLEALSCGLPVLATNVGGIPEIIVNGVNGILVPPKNPEAIAEGLLKLNSDPSLRVKLGSEARKSILKQFTVERILKQYQIIFENILTD